ncbi:DUF2911 domain-containing protein [soil metagenome]
MKSIFSFVAIATFVFSALNVNAQDKNKRPSPPDKVTVTTSKGVTISVDYSQPSVKGRTIGKEIAPFGKIWRTGANEATVFETNKDVKIDGKTLKAGKYGLYTIPGEKDWTIIFNNKSTLWGDDGYSESDDALRLMTPAGKPLTFTEKMTFSIEKSGKISLMWGDIMVSFMVN